MESVERHGDSHGRHSPLRSVSRNANEKSSYRLFPIANQRPQVSPRTLQRETLSRNGSISKRRSASLDDSSRPQFAAARGPPSRNGPAPVPRLQPVPADRQKGTKPQGGQQSSDVPDVLPYKPRVSDDGGHGRSSSAPGDITKSDMKEGRFATRTNMAAAARAGFSKPLRSLGGSWYDDRQSVIKPNTSPEATRGKNGKANPKLEKPLPPPPPPKDSDAQNGTFLDASHSRSHSTPLSPSPRSAFYMTPNSESSSELTPLETPSSLDPNRKSYFPLSADAQMRRLMGIDETPNVPSVPRLPAVPLLRTREAPPQGQNAHVAALKYNRDKSLPPIVLDAASTVKNPASNDVGKVDKVSAPAPVPAPAAKPQDGSRSLAPPSPTFSQASSALKPAALRITSPKRSVSVSSTLDRRPLQSRVHAAKELLGNKPTRQPSNAQKESTATILMTLSELSTQTENLHARYASLREERQALSGSITEALREHKAGPEYTNTLLDQHMSLSTICSSMDICIAKLKAVSKRRDRMMATLITGQGPTKPKQPNGQEPQPAPAPSFMQPNSSAPSSTMTTPQKPIYPAPLNTNQGNGVGFPIQQPPRSGRSYTVARAHSIARSRSVSSRASSRLDSEYDMSDNDAPRRVNMKGAKAAKILGLVVESPETETTPETSKTYPMDSSKLNLSTSSLDRDLFTRGPSPAPDRPLPARPSVRKLKRDNAPAPLTLQNTTTQPRAHAAQNSVGTSAGSSSRTSSPADDRGAETPQEEYPSPGGDAKSPGMQTVHVYFPDNKTYCSSIYSSTFSEVGEDELLEYYGYLR